MRNPDLHEERSVALDVLGAADLQNLEFFLDGVLDLLLPLFCSESPLVLFTEVVLSLDDRR